MGVGSGIFFFVIFCLRENVDKRGIIIGVIFFL